jgi:predicted phosphoribosyltransferase
MKIDWFNIAISFGGVLLGFSLATNLGLIFYIAKLLILGP